MTHPLLTVRGLSVHAPTGPLLQPLSFSLEAGECLVLMGESGAGKSLLAQAIMGALPPGLRAAGEVVLDGVASAAADGTARRPAWGRRLALLPQEPAVALSPLMRLRAQLAEVHACVRGTGWDAADRLADDALDRVGLGAARARLPSELSGGMAQRAAAAIATAGGARVVLADEPTKGLDAHWRDAAVRTMRDGAAQGQALVVITHDVAVAKQLGGRILVLRQGEVVESGDTHTVLQSPAHPFTRELLAADPSAWHRHAGAVRPDAPPLIEVHGVSKRWQGPPVFDQVDLCVREGQRLALVGPSGGGKSTLGQILLGLLPPDTGRVVRHRAAAGTACQKLYQDPVKAFPPTQPLRDHLREVMRRHGGQWTTVSTWLARVGLDESLLHRPATQVSGGELQRLALVRALLARPRFVFADEPTSRLDPLTQQATVRGLVDALDELGAAMLLVTHDEALAGALSERVLSLRDGRLSA